ncbi:MAG: hypothetical protein AAGI63_08800, partial [Planctomycetota bacterium]
SHLSTDFLDKLRKSGVVRFFPFLVTGEAPQTSIGCCGLPPTENDIHVINRSLITLSINPFVADIR